MYFKFEQKLFIDQLVIDGNKSFFSIYNNRNHHGFWMSMSEKKLFKSVSIMDFPPSSFRTEAYLFIVTTAILGFK